MACVSPIEYRETTRVVKKFDGRFHDSQPEALLGYKFFS